MPDLSSEKKSYARALAIGTALSVLVVVMAQYSVNVIHGSYLAIDHMPAGGIFIFFVLVGIVCAILRAFSRRFDLSSSELIIIYAMMLVTSSIAEMGFGLQFLPLLSGSYYYASPENKWDEMIHPYVNHAFVPHSQEAVRWLFEGAPTGAQIPWSAWVKPLAVWFPFIFTLYFVMICLMVILRRQWMESERIVYPLSLLPIEMVKQDERGSRPFFRSRLMWIGFAIPVILSSLKGLNHYYPLVPYIELVRGVGILRNTAFLQFRISFPIIGFAYFINLKVAFGLWVFNLISTILRSVFAITGVTSYETMTGYGAWTPIFKHLGMGAMIVFVLYGLWPARFHLWGVLKTMLMFRRDAGAQPPSAADNGGQPPSAVRHGGSGATVLHGDAEIMSHRTAGWGLVLGILFMGFWLNCSGMPLWVSFVFIGTALLIFLGLTRIVAESGMPTLIAPSIAPDQIMSSLGANALGPSGLATLAFTFIWSADIRTFAMSSAAHSLKLTEVLSGSKKAMLWAMLLAIVIGVVGSTVVLMSLCYQHGGANMNQWYFVGNIRVAYSTIAYKLQEQSGPNWEGWAWKGTGATTMALLTLAYRRLLWWPLHPIGFVIGACGWMNLLWFSVFLAWFIKALVLRFGGGQLYRQARPFFLGLVLGQYTAAGFWFVVDAITGTTGNVVFWI